MQFLFYFQNLTITRIPIQDLCYVRSKSRDEPPLDVLKKSMDKVLLTIFKEKGVQRGRKRKKFAPDPRFAPKNDAGSLGD